MISINEINQFRAKLHNYQKVLLIKIAWNNHYLDKNYGDRIILFKPEKIHANYSF